MKKILFLLEDLRYGGVEMSFVNLVNAIDGHKITLLTWGKEDALSCKLKNKNIRIKRIPPFISNSLYSFLKLFIKPEKATMYKTWVNKLLIHFHLVLTQYDVTINYHYKNNASLLRTLKKNGNFVAWYHSSKYYDYHFQEKYTHKYNKIVVVNDLCAEVICRHNPALTDKITSIENLVPYSEIMEKSKIGEDLFEKDCFNIVTCARLDQEKGIDTAVEACRILKEKISGFKWYLIGDAIDSKKEYENQIKELIKKYELEDTFILSGSKQNPFPYFAQCDLYVQPSKEEACPLTTTEAQVCGAVIVATDTVGARHLIKNGETGIITDNNPDALAEGIYEMYNDNEKRNFISENVKKLDFEESNQKILNKFYDLIGVTTDRE